MFLIVEQKIKDHIDLLLKAELFRACNHINWLLHLHYTTKNKDCLKHISSDHDEVTDGYHIRRMSIDKNIPLITNVQFAKTLIRPLEKH